MSRNPEIKRKVSDLEELEPINKEVLTSDKEIEDRNHALQKAVSYGAKFRIEALLVIATALGDMKVRSVVFQANDRFVQIKGKVLIPTGSIRSVEFL